jgi:hypothetical protein
MMIFLGQSAATSRLGSNYADKEAAIDIHGTEKKKSLSKKILHS